MNDEKNSKLSPDELQRLVSFFELLAEIDQRECITPTAKKIRAEREQKIKAALLSELKKDR